MELWCTAAWWFGSRWNNCKPADAPTWQVLNGYQWCFSQCRRYWPLYVIFFLLLILFTLWWWNIVFSIYYVCTCCVARAYCCSINSSIWSNCYCILMVLWYEQKGQKIYMKVVLSSIRHGTMAWRILFQTP